MIIIIKPKKYNEIVIVIKIIKTLVMLIVVADAFWVEAS